VLAGGRLATAGYNEAFGTLGLSAGSVLDLGAGQSIVHFAPSSTSNWTGLLSIANWDGDWRNGSGAGQVVFGNSIGGLDASQLGQIQFAGFPVGGKLLPTGEMLPASPPIPTAGDLDQDAHVTLADIGPMMRALVDLGNYQAANQLSDPNLKTIADLNIDGAINNLDLQVLIAQVANGTPAGGGNLSGTAVPEPPAIACAALALLAFWASFRREIRAFQGPRLIA